MVSEFTKSPHCAEDSSILSEDFVRYSARVFRDTVHESCRKTNQALPRHCNHPSTTRAIHNRCLLWSYRGGFPKRCRPHRRLYSSTFTFVLARREQVAVSCHLASADKDDVFSTLDHLCAEEFAKRWTACTIASLLHWNISISLSTGCPSAAVRAVVVGLALFSFLVVRPRVVPV